VGHRKRYSGRAVERGGTQRRGGSGFGLQSRRYAFCGLGT
jgi:hypothetical protein